MPPKPDPSVDDFNVLRLYIMLDALRDLYLLELDHWKHNSWWKMQWATPQQWFQSIKLWLFLNLAVDLQLYLCTCLAHSLELYGYHHSAQAPKESTIKISSLWCKSWCQGSCQGNVNSGMSATTSRLVSLGFILKTIPMFPSYQWVYCAYIIHRFNYDAKMPNRGSLTSWIEFRTWIV